MISFCDKFQRSVVPDDVVNDLKRTPSQGDTDRCRLYSHNCHWCTQERCGSAGESTDKCSQKQVDKDNRGKPQVVFTASHGKNVFMVFLPAKNHERIGRINADFMKLVGGKVDVRMLLGNAACGLDYCCKYSLLDKDGDVQFTEETSAAAVLERMQATQEQAAHKWVGSHEQESTERKMLWAFTHGTLRACANREGTSAQMVVSEILRSTYRHSESLIGNSTHVRTPDWVKTEPVPFEMKGIDSANRRCLEQDAESSDSIWHASLSARTAFLYLNRTDSDTEERFDSSGDGPAAKAMRKLRRTVPNMCLFDFVSSFDVIDQVRTWLGRTSTGVVKKQLCYRTPRFGVNLQGTQEVEALCLKICQFWQTKFPDRGHNPEGYRSAWFGEHMQQLSEADKRLLPKALETLTGTNLASSVSISNEKFYAVRDDAEVTLINTKELARFFRGHLHWYCKIPADDGSKLGFDCIFGEEFAKKAYPVEYCDFTADECKVVLRRALSFFMSQDCYAHWYRHKTFAPRLMSVISSEDRPKHSRFLAGTGARDEQKKKKSKKNEGGEEQEEQGEEQKEEVENDEEEQDEVEKELPLHPWYTAMMVSCEPQKGSEANSPVNCQSADQQEKGADAELNKSIEELTGFDAVAFLAGDA